MGVGTIELGRKVRVVGPSARGALLPAGDELLVARVVAGDDSALATAYDRHAAYVFSLALRVSHDRSIAEDVTQDVFVFLWTHADRYDAGRGSLATWLGTIAHRRTVDRVRREEARRAREDRERALVVGDDRDLSDDAVRSLTRDRVRCALASLPEEQRRCIELAYLGGKTFREVAVVLGIAEGTAKSRIRLALAKLAGVLEGAVA